MTANDLAFYYYVGFLTNIIYLTVAGFMVPSDETEIRWKKVIESGHKHGLPPTVSVTIIYLMSFWWPFTLVWKVIKLLRKKEK